MLQDLRWFRKYAKFFYKKDITTFSISMSSLVGKHWLGYQQV